MEETETRNGKSTQHDRRDIRLWHYDMHTRHNSGAKLAKARLPAFRLGCWKGAKATRAEDMSCMGTRRALTRYHPTSNFGTARGCQRHVRNTRCSDHGSSPACGPRNRSTKDIQRPRSCCGLRCSPCCLPRVRLLRPGPNTPSPAPWSRTCGPAGPGLCHRPCHACQMNLEDPTSLP